VRRIKLLPLPLACHWSNVYLAVKVGIAVVSGITTEDSEINHGYQLFLFCSQRGKGLTLSTVVTLATISFNMSLGGDL